MIVPSLRPSKVNRPPVAGQGDPEYRLVLTREGWLQPWVRTRKTEDDERRRLASMPAFHTLSRVGNLKPGAVVLSEVRDPAGNTVPALVAQQFGARVAHADRHYELMAPHLALQTVSVI